MGPSGSGLEALFNYLVNPANAEVHMGQDAKGKPGAFNIGPETFRYVNEPVKFDPEAMKKFSKMRAIDTTDPKGFENAASMPLSALMTQSPYFNNTQNVSGIPVSRYKPMSPDDLAGWYNPATNAMAAGRHPYIGLEEVIRHETGHGYQTERGMTITDWDALQQEGRKRFPKDPVKADEYARELYKKAISEAMLFADQEARKQNRPTGSDIRDFLPNELFFGNDFNQLFKVR